MMAGVVGGTSRLFRGLRQSLSLGRSDRSFVRRHARHRVLLRATLTLVKWNFPLEGQINEISLSGVRFRPASTHILARRDVECYVTIGDSVYRGAISHTASLGYGIQLAQAFDEATFSRFLDAGKETLREEGTRRLAPSGSLFTGDQTH